MENNINNTRVITIRHLLQILIHRLWIMALAAIVCAGGLFIINQLTFTPQYNSTATLYILRQDTKDQVYNTDSEFSLALKVVNDCTYLLKSHAVIDEVIDTIGLDMTYEQLNRKISTSNPDNTRILEVTVEADTPEQAKEIADNLCQVGQEKITEAMGFQQVNFYERGTLNYQPCNKVSLTFYVLIGIVAAMLVYAIFLITFLLDDRIRTDEDIQQYLGLSVLGNIPNADSGSKNKYGYYSAYTQNTVTKIAKKGKR